MEPTDFQSLDAYMNYIMGRSFLFLRPPKDAVFMNTSGIENGGAIRSVVLDRRGQFQTELFLATQEVRNADVHTHPGIDSAEIPVAGDFLFSINGASDTQNSKSDSQRIGDNNLVSVPEDMPHGARIDNGACFLSFQHWKLKAPTSVGHSFVISK